MTMQTCSYAIDAWAPVVPVPWARPRWSGKTRTAYTEEGAARGAAAQAAMLARYSPSEPYEGPLGLVLVYQLPMPASWSKGGRAKFDRTPHKQRPDLDNLCKLTLDVLSRLKWWADDAQVCRIAASKIWSSVPGVQVRLEVL